MKSALFPSRHNKLPSKTIKYLLLEIYWFSKAPKDNIEYVKVCARIQMSPAVSKCRTTLCLFVLKVLQSYSNSSAGSVPVRNAVNSFLLLSANHTTTVEMSTDFIRDRILLSFRPPRRLASDNTICNTAAAIVGYMNSHGVTWKAVLRYFSIPDALAERMFGITKEASRETALESADNFEEALLRYTTDSVRTGW